LPHELLTQEPDSIIGSKRVSAKRVTDSHRIYFHKELKRTVVVPIHGNKEIPAGAFMSILKHAGISKDNI
jgi:predicted RNA binding protein YcfA (HicA-like mRNA interferase family)